MKKFSILLLSLAMLSSCVSKKKFTEMETNRNQLQASLNELQTDFDSCQATVAALESDVEVGRGELETERRQYTMLQTRLDSVQKTNTNLLVRLEDMDIVDEAGAESIRKSLEMINEQNKHIRDLKSSVARKDSLNQMLIMKLTRSLGDLADDDDVDVEVRKGVVYISLSDKLLFRSGSFRINKAADTVLAKIAKVINDHKGFDVLVEGHTDEVPVASISCVQDNWDLSAKRAIAVVRELQDEFGVAPERLTAGGKSYYVPKINDKSEDGRSQNRRTEIVILPKLDEYFALMATADEERNDNQNNQNRNNPNPNPNPNDQNRNNQNPNPNDQNRNNLNPNPTPNDQTPKTPNHQNHQTPNPDDDGDGNQK